MVTAPAGKSDDVVVRVGDEAAARAGPEVHPVRARRGQDRLVVAIADGERVGHGVLERDVAAGEVAHRLLGLGRHVVVPHAVVAGAVVADPAVVQVPRVLGVHLRRVHVERQQVAEVRPGRVRLLEDGGAVRVLQRLLVREAAHALQAAEVVVERPVLLHEDHDMLEIADRAGEVMRPRRRGRPGRPGDPGDPAELRARARGERHPGGRAAHAEEPAARDGCLERRLEAVVGGGAGGAGGAGFFPAATCAGGVGAVHVDDGPRPLSRTQRSHPRQCESRIQRQGADSRRMFRQKADERAEDGRQGLQVREPGMSRVGAGE